MENTEATLLRAGAKDQLLADFGALKEATCLEGLPKYSERPTLENLAKFIAAQSGGPNKDMALLELSHLVYGVSVLLGKEALIDFFLSPEKPAATALNLCWQQVRKVRLSAWKIPAYAFIMTIRPFQVRYGRMGFLVALYEFLASMENFAHFNIITDVFDSLISTPLSLKSLKDSTNALASIMRKYRLTYVTSAEGDGKFTQVFKFLQNVSENAQIILKDDSVLDFWCLHNTGKEYRGYRTVFNLFCDFAHAFEESRRGENAHRAAVLA